MSPLSEYQTKRDFKKTNEPKAKKDKESKVPIFVVQKHDATRLHYDFRLEVGGVLKSWAVPKGPSDNPKEKRLAVMTEDHPLAYADFSGTIPAGEYGGGTVEIWDRGTYENITKKKDGAPITMASALRQGQVEINLHGKKLKGHYALVRTRLGNDPKNWLLIKMKNL